MDFANVLSELDGNVVAAIIAYYLASAPKEGESPKSDEERLPTGVDLTFSQWRSVYEETNSKGLKTVSYNRMVKVASCCDDWVTVYRIGISVLDFIRANLACERIFRSELALSELIKAYQRLVDLKEDDALRVLICGRIAKAKGTREEWEEIHQHATTVELEQLALKKLWAIND